MKPEDKKRFASAISALADYYSKPLSDGSIGLYWQGLQNHDIESIERAIGMHLQNPDSGQWMPKIADLIRMIDGTTQDSAVMAWAKVQQAVGSVGMYQSLAFDDPIIHLVISDLGGWMEICRTLEEELPFLAKRFETNYRAYRRRGHDIPDYPRYLAGVSEMTNHVNGFKSDPPKLVGDPVKAKAVLLGGTDKARLQISSLGSAAESIRLVHRQDAA